MKLSRIKLFTILTGLLLLSGCDKPSPIMPSGNTIKIGVIAPLSGSSLQKGKEGIKGIHYLLNTQPLLENGDKIELYIKDDLNKPELSTQALKELVKKHQVTAVLSLSSSHVVLELGKIANKYNTPIISLFATNPGITQNNNYITPFGYNDHFQGVAAALFVHDELLIERVAIFKNSNNIYSKDLADAFKNKFKSVRGQILLDADYINNNRQLTQILSEMRNKKVQLIYLPIDANQVINIVNVLNKLNWQPKTMGADGLLVNILIDHKKDINKLNGMITTDFYSSDLPMTEFGSVVKQGYESKDNDLTSYSMMGIESISLLKQLLNQCSKKLKNKCIQEQLNAGVTYTGLLGKISINSDRTTQRVLLVNEINNGELNNIVQIY